MFPIPPTRVVNQSQPQAMKRTRVSDADVLAKARLHQVTELLRLNNGARALNSDSSIYEIPIQTVYGRLTLNVLLPPSFPIQSPVIQVASLVDHPWVDSDMYLAHHPKLNGGWDAKTSSLGSIVHEVVSEWTKNPPMPQTVSIHSSGGGNNSASASNSASMSDSPSGINGGNIHSDWIMVDGASSPAAAITIAAAEKKSPADQPHPSSQSQSQSTSLLLPIPSSFAFLESCSTPELERMAADPSHQLLHDALYTLDSVSHIEQVKSDMYKSLEESIATNITQAENYENLRVRLAKLRETVHDAQLRWQEANRKQQEIVQRFTPSGLVSVMDEAIVDAEAKSNELFEAHLNRSMDNVSANGAEAVSVRRNVDNHARFIDAYSKQRALVHLRQAKRDRVVASGMKSS